MIYDSFTIVCVWGSKEWGCTARSGNGLSCGQCIQWSQYIQICVSLYVCSVPGGDTIARFLGLYDKSCLACGKAVKVKDSTDVYICSTQTCTGHSNIHVKYNIAFNIITQIFSSLNHKESTTFCYSICKPLISLVDKRLKKSAQV